MNSALYKQYDSRWASKPYPTKSSSFSGNGCGCCACTHCVIELPQYASYTPEPLRKWMVNQGYAVAGKGTTWSGIPATLKHYGFSNVVHIDIDDPMSKAWKELNKGNHIGVILFKGGKAPNGTVWTAGGHYVAFTDYYVGSDGRHYFYTKDSGGRDHDSVKHGYYSYERSMKGLVYQMWIVERGSSPAPTPPTPTPTTDPTPKKGKYTGKYPAPKSYLEKGDKGTEVKKLQKYLNWSFGGQSGFTKLAEDGIFGAATKKWTVQFQEKAMGKGQGDGKVGKKTIAKMKEYGNC